MPQSLGRPNRVNTGHVYRNQWIKKSPISHGVFYPGPLQAGKANNNKIYSNKKAILKNI